MVVRCFSVYLGIGQLWQRKLDFDNSAADVTPLKQPQNAGLPPLEVLLVGFEIGVHLKKTV